MEMSWSSGSTFSSGPTSVRRHQRGEHPQGGSRCDDGLVNSSTWADRAALGESLASQVGDASVDERLVALLLDPEDTAVTFRTAVALLERRDPRAVRLVIVASASADEDTSNWIGGALNDFRADSLQNEEFLRAALEELHEDPESSCARAAHAWSAWCAFG